MSAAPRLSRRALLRSLGLGAGAVALSGLPASALTGAPVAPSTPALQVARVWARSGRQATALAAFDDTHALFGDGSIELLLWPGDRRRLDGLGVDYDITVADLFAGRRRALAAAVPQQPGQRDDYRHWTDFEADLRDLAARFPDKARLLALPTASLAGRAVFGIEIASNVNRYDGRPVVHHDGMHHAREWPAAEMPMMWAVDLLESYGTDPRITTIVDHARTIIVPNLNPDGFVRSRESLAQSDSGTADFGLGSFPLAIAGLESYWRKNLRPTGPGVSAHVGEAGYDNADAHGIDLNRNYPFLWGDDEGSSDVPFDQTYRGTAPYSEPESHNIRDLVLRHAPVTAITHHTSGEIMLFAWGRDPEEVKSPDFDTMLGLGEAMAVSNGYRPQQAFRLYPTSGTSRDWAHSSVRSIIYTFEHGEEFHGPYADTIPAMYEKNRNAFLIHAEAAMDPSIHAVIRGRVAGHRRKRRDAVVHIRKTFTTPTAQGTEVEETVDTFVKPTGDGTFAIHLPPSTRPHLVEERFGGDAGTTEPWQVVVTGPNGEKAPIPVVVDRGDDADIGEIRI